jgi:MFS family permease
MTFAVRRLKLDLIAAGVLLATAQAGGLTGLLLFGLVATRYLSAWATLIALGLAMSGCSALVAFVDLGASWPSLLVIAFAFGVTASGWNGVYLAEVARLAPEGRVGEATGAALMFGFAGLILGPLVMAGVAPVADLGVSYAVLGTATLLGTVVLLGRSR